jgi:flagellar protein FliJ
MSKPFSLEPVRNLAQQKTDAAAAALSGLKASEAKARETLSMLEQCRGEYVTRLEQALARGIGPAELHNFQDFMAKLERAIAQQREAVGQAEARSRIGLVDWQLQMQKLKSFDVLAEREGRLHRQQEQKLEQKQLDEHAASGHRRAQGRE